MNEHASAKHVLQEAIDEGLEYTVIVCNRKENEISIYSSNHGYDVIMMLLAGTKITAEYNRAADRGSARMELYRALFAGE